MASPGFCSSLPWTKSRPASGVNRMQPLGPGAGRAGPSAPPPPNPASHSVKGEWKHIIECVYCGQYQNILASTMTRTILVVASSGCLYSKGTPPPLLLHRIVVFWGGVIFIMFHRKNTGVTTSMVIVGNTKTCKHREKTKSSDSQQHIVRGGARGPPVACATRSCFHVTCPPGRSLSAPKAFALLIRHRGSKREWRKRLA